MPAPLQLAIALTWDGRPAEGPTPRLSLRAAPDGLELEVDAPFHGDLPPPGAPGPTPRLWEHEVVELFIQGAQGGPYTEVELGPHGHHLVLRLGAVRQVRDQLHPIAFTAEITGDRWTGRARLPRALLPPGPWRGNATAIHGPPEGRVYQTWAPLPGPQPDFHQPARFRPLPVDPAPARSS